MGDAAPKPRTRASRRKPPANERTRPRNLHLSDDVHDRLWLLSRERGKTVSAVANDLLDRALPRYKLERQG